MFQATCEIDWIAAGVGRYGVAVVLEDYAPSHPNQLLSEVPLQFVVDVAAATVSCDEQPFFCCDTPDDSECFAISMNSMFNFTVSANHTSRDHSYDTLLRKFSSHTLICDMLQSQSCGLIRTLGYD